MSRPTSRVLAVLELLQSGGTRTRAELAERLGVDERTVRRYVGHLIDLEIPVVSVGGGTAATGWAAVPAAPADVHRRRGGGRLPRTGRRVAYGTADGRGRRGRDRASQDPAGAAHGPGGPAGRPARHGVVHR